MYMDDYKRWLAADLEDPALTEELRQIAGKDEQIKDRFAVALKFVSTPPGYTLQTPILSALASLVRILLMPSIASLVAL